MYLFTQPIKDHTPAQKPTQCVKHAYTHDHITCIMFEIASWPSTIESGCMNVLSLVALHNC